MTESTPLIPDSAESSLSVEVLSDNLKVAFSDSRFSDAHGIIDQIKAIEPENEFAAYIEKKVTKLEAKAKEVAHRQEINEWEEKIKKAFKETCFDAVKEDAKTLQGLEADNKIAAKFLAKVAKEEQRARESLEKNKESGVVKKESAWQHLIQGLKEPFKTKLKIQDSMPVSSENPPEEEGNIFTNIFHKKGEEIKEKSIIETIVKQSDQQTTETKEEKTEETRMDFGLKALGVAKLSAQLAAAFMVLTGIFFYAQVIDSNNRLMGLLGIEDNFASRLHGAGEVLSQQEEKERSIHQEIKQYEGGYKNQYEKNIQTVIKRRIDWPIIINRISEVANSIYEHNDLSQYIRFNGYSFDAVSKQVVVTGSLSDPLGQNLTKLAELEAAFESYPGSQNKNGEAGVFPYFYGVEGDRNLGKSLSGDDNKYLSNFRFTFYLEAPKNEASAPLETNE